MQRTRAFTLIELLVVVAIIAILMAVLMPVFVSARLVFQRYAGANAMKQIATMATMYATDFDETLPSYRQSGMHGAFCDPQTQCINPDYIKATVAVGSSTANQWFGERTRDSLFYYQTLWSYGATERLFKSPGNPNAWAGADRLGRSTDSPAFRSYGGQNSYGVNWYLFTNPTPWSWTGGGLALGQIDRQAETAFLFDATYYIVFPRNPRYLNGNVNATLTACEPIYKNYWKNLGNSSLFLPTGEPTNEVAEMLGAQRWAGIINVISLDNSSHARKYQDVLNNLEVKDAESYWDPYKQGSQPCPIYD